MAEHPGWEVSFAGNYYNNQALVKQLLLVLLLSVALLYFIMTIQFESFLQPLIILVEIPIDFLGALLILWLFDASINLMSITGIIIMSGIVINDSIIKIDTINQSRRENISLNKAIITGGTRRINAIVITSLTTILAFIPILFFKGMGAQLQAPLALAVIGGLSLGTLVSLFIVPLLYYYAAKRK